MISKEESWIAKGKKDFQRGEMDFEMSVKPVEIDIHTIDSVAANPDDPEKWEFEGCVHVFRVRMRLGNFVKTYHSFALNKESVLSCLATAFSDLSKQLELPYVPLDDNLSAPCSQSLSEVIRKCEDEITMANLHKPKLS